MTVSHIHTEFWHRDPRARQLVLVGLVLVASGLAHGAFWALVGGPWEGPVTWRKPILFGISGGLTSLSLGWIWSTLPRRRGDGWLPAATAWALFVEVLLIDLQRWRGVASHFNRATAIDSFVYDAMGVLILFVTAVIVDLTARLLFSRVALTPDMLLAARAGMVLLAVSCGLGIWVSINGDLRVAAGLDPGGYGVAGVAKFPHGAVIHAIQWLPAIAWIARRAGITTGPRWWFVALASGLTVALLVFALAQTLAGRARFDVLRWWPADTPTQEIDHVAVRELPRYTVAHSVVDEAVASDHRPILAVFTLATGEPAIPPAGFAKIAFDLDSLDIHGLAGGPDGKVAVSYEFRIPDTLDNRGLVQAIDPGVRITTGPRGRVDAGPGFALCLGSTHQPRHREILLALARLPFVERIVECFFE